MRGTHLRIAFISLFLQSVIAGPVNAQITAPVRDFTIVSHELPKDSIAIAHDVDAGLGWLLAGTQDTHRYTTPKMCRALMEIVDHDARTWTGWDTVVVGTRGDTLGTAARTLGAQCAAGFTATKVSSRQLPDLMALALTLDNVPLATAALDRRVREAKTPDQQGHALLEAVNMFLDAHPARVAAAEALLPRFDALQTTVPWFKLLAQRRFIAFGPDTADTTKVRRYYHANLAAYQTLSPNARTFLADATGGNADVVDVLDGLTGVPLPRRCNQIADAYIAWPQAAQPVNRAELQDTVNGYDPTSRRGAEIIRQNCLADTAASRQKIPTFPHGTWFAPGSITPASAPIAPTPGHITWLVEASLRDGRLHTDRPPEDLALVRRLYEKYHKNGLDVILIVRTLAKSVWASPPLDPADVAKTAAWYFHDYLKLPMPLLVAQSEDAMDYGYWFAPLYDRQGNVVQQFPTSPILMETYIRHALGLAIQ